MFLKYGIDQHDEIWYVDDAPRGLADLKCPYCGGQLLTCKGEVKAHHFAHAGETCRQSERSEDVLSIPGYDRFDLHIPGELWGLLHRFYDGEFLRSAQLGALEENELIKLSWGSSSDYQLTNIGKIPFGELSLMLFDQWQWPLIWGKHSELVNDVRKARNVSNLPTHLTDLRLYRAQLQRLLKSTLYIMEVQGAGLWKVGVITRDVKERAAEVQADVKRHLGDHVVKLVDSWPHRGNIELYFKHRYSSFQQPIAKLTEYFAFGDVKPVLRDLRRVKKKELAPTERDILDSLPHPIELEIEREAQDERWRESIKEGMARAARRGKHVGRPIGSTEDAEAFLAKESSQKVLWALKTGLSLRQAARYAQVSVNTVRKVKEMALGTE